MQVEKQTQNKLGKVLPHLWEWVCKRVKERERDRECERERENVCEYGVCVRWVCMVGVVVCVCFLCVVRGASAVVCVRGSL